MEIKLVGKSEMKNAKNIEIKSSPGEKCQLKEVPMELLPKDMVFCHEVDCKRIKLGMTNNCAICQNMNNDIFIKCQTKYE